MIPFIVTNSNYHQLCQQLITLSSSDSALSATINTISNNQQLSETRSSNEQLTLLLKLGCKHACRVHIVCVVHLMIMMMMKMMMITMMIVMMVMMMRMITSSGLIVASVSSHSFSTNPISPIWIIWYRYLHHHETRRDDHDIGQIYRLSEQRDNNCICDDKLCGEFGFLTSG